MTHPDKREIYQGIHNQASELIVACTEQNGFQPRYGQVIFSSAGNGKPWDGTQKGKAVLIGVYYYYILDFGDGSPRQNGSIPLLR